jgi:Zn-dependent protease with chaperone function
MHSLLGVAVSLAVFGLLYSALSLVVNCAWRPLSRVLSGCRASVKAAALFTVRVLPFITAGAITLLITLPSFLLLEPHGADEPLGIAPFALAFGCSTLLAWGTLRAVIAQRRTSRALAGWLRGAISLRSTSEIPVYRAADQAPALMVAGVCAPKVIVSAAAVATLTEDELRSALRHEIAHVRRHDNLKKLVFRFCAWPGMTDLEVAWSEATELAADDDAVSCEQDALDLAAALIKVSRLVAQPTAELATGLLQPPAPSVSARVQRLLAWGNVAHEEGSVSWQYVLPPVCLSLLALVMAYGSVLTQMHEFTEWLVR